MSRKIKIGLIGCGAVVEKFHLPALQKIKGIEIHTLVDKDLKRIKKLQAQYKAKKTTDDYKKILNEIDIAVIALPNYLHSPISIECLKHGVHVFCEKPMAINFKEAKEMIRTAKENKSKLGIGMVRRYFKINQKIKQLLDSQSLGKIKSFTYEEGFPFSWPLKSTYAFNKKQAGGGVLIDTGAHVIDLIIGLFGKPTKIDYQDDSYGGVEANCQINLEFGSIQGRIELSRDRTLKNIFQVIGQKDSWKTPAGGAIGETFEDCILKELSEFINAVKNNSHSFVSGKDALESIKIINYCYSHQKQINEPWSEI